MSLLGESRRADAMEDVELDRGAMFTMLDTSRPLMVDSASRAPLTHVWFFLTAMVGLVLILSFVVPKDRLFDYSFFKVHIYDANHIREYRVKLSGLSETASNLWIAALLLRRCSPFGHAGDISFGLRMAKYRDSNVVARQEIPLVGHRVTYHPRHRLSPYIPISRLSIDSIDSIDVNVSVEFDNEPVDLIVIETSTSNPDASIIKRQAVVSFGFVLVVSFIYILVKFEARLEHLLTCILVLLLFISSFCVSFEHGPLHYLECVTIGVFRMFLFYAMAFLSNKHRTRITQVGLGLLGVTSLLDILSKWRFLSTSVSLFGNHDILVHLFVAAVICSTVAAMSVFSEERYQFDIYFVLVSISFAATILFRDLPLFSLLVTPYLQTGIAFYGVHIVLFSVLVFLHQGIRGTKSDITNLNADLRDPPSKLVL